MWPWQLGSRLVTAIERSAVALSSISVSLHQLVQMEATSRGVVLTAPGPTVPDDDQVDRVDDRRTAEEEERAALTGAVLPDLPYPRDPGPGAVAEVQGLWANWPTGGPQ